MIHQDRWRSRVPVRWAVGVCIILLFIYLAASLFWVPVHRRSIVFVDTNEYMETTSRLPISPKQARAIMIESPVFASKHVVLIDNWYVFSPPEKGGISLEGIYVHGVTGKIEKRWDEKPPRIPIWQARLMGYPESRRSNVHQRDVVLIIAVAVGGGLTLLGVGFLALRSGKNSEKEE